MADGEVDGYDVKLQADAAASAPLVSFDSNGAPVFVNSDALAQQMDSPSSNASAAASSSHSASTAATSQFAVEIAPKLEELDAAVPPVLHIRTTSYVAQQQQDTASGTPTTESQSRSRSSSTKVEGATVSDMSEDATAALIKLEQQQEPRPSEMLKGTPKRKSSRNVGVSSPSTPRTAKKERQEAAQFDFKPIFVLDLPDAEEKASSLGLEISLTLLTCISRQ